MLKTRKNIQGSGYTLTRSFSTLKDSNLTKLHKTSLIGKSCPDYIEDL